MRGFSIVLGAVFATCVSVSAGAQAPEDQLAQVVESLMLPAGTESSYADWLAIESVKQIHWQPLPPNMLKDALPDGSYFTRKGVANIAGRPFGVVATGARTMVIHVYFRNVSASPIGEAPAIAALQRHGFALQLARCPIKGAAGAANKWWRIDGRNKRAAWFKSQTDCNGAKCEAYALLLDETLPSMTPQEQRLYTDRCTGDTAGTAAPAPAPAAWDEQLASLFVALVATGDAKAVSWPEIEKAGAVSWAPMPPQEMLNPPWSDTENHFYRGGQAELGGRKLYLTATGSKASVLSIHVEDQTTQANRGDVLQALQRKGFVTQLARCGIRYQLSTENWYRVTGPGIRPVMLQRNVRCDTATCPEAQEVYTLSLAGVLPQLKAGEVTAVRGSCPGR